MIYHGAKDEKRIPLGNCFSSFNKGNSYSVSRSALEKVAKYIERQDEHHREKSFTEEYREWAEKYGVWDGEY